MKHHFHPLRLGRPFLRILACCIPMLVAALPSAYAQTITNNANVSFGVHYRIHNGDCTSSYLVLDTCVTVPANSFHPLNLIPPQFLLGTKIQCEDCGETNPYVGSSTSCPSSRMGFYCGEIRYVVSQGGNNVIINEL